MLRVSTFFAALLLVPFATAECWLRSDGVRICSEDGLEWLAMWWFWFAVLFFLCTCTGGSYIYHRRHLNSLYQQGFVTYSEPLIMHDELKKPGSEADRSHVQKIFYR
ncbi:Aste57867_23756 [Aphanomyces stellatus]|uniref:Aste57867_23756 protein n=1 Tax=Aphanomyces stellatus TaxID=120398 RepID=A0A485LNQ0_9STRA|nr:hypothetical protein As57867_023684 [Aphanomyces stellatus]VFU00401.1 Aste57867_23756 [Aphanomyces stellatus]